MCPSRISLIKFRDKNTPQYRMTFHYLDEFRNAIVENHRITVNGGFFDLFV